jgi:hypothetical protein
LKRVDFDKKMHSLDYEVEINNLELIIRYIGNSDWYGYCVARILLEEEYGVHFDYCVPFSKELYEAIYEFISTPIENR